MSSTEQQNISDQSIIEDLNNTPDILDNPKQALDNNVYQLNHINNEYTDNKEEIDNKTRKFILFQVSVTPFASAVPTGVDEPNVKSDDFKTNEAV